MTPQPETFNATRCSACASLLDLPAVHFLCKHSFHQRCLNVSDDDDGGDGAAAAAECPVCAPQNETVRQIRAAQRESAGMHELFVDALGRSRDRFGTVAEWFGRGVMSGGAGGAA